MKQYFVISIFILLLLSLGYQVNAQTAKLDAIDFMRADFNINGFTELNSYLAQNIHSYDKDQKKWIHHTELPSCPQEFTCDSTSWLARYMTRQKPGENILYLNKGAIPNLPNRIPETFWYNNDSVYDFEEGYARNRTDARDPTIFGLFHNLHHTPVNNSFIEFPYRGQFWTKRYVASGDVTPWIYQVQTTEYKNMKLLVKDKFPYYFRVRVEYDPNWDGSQNSWNGKPDTGNLPRPLEVIKLINEWKDGAGTIKGGETYIYGKSGNNSFGLIRYEKWDPKESACGSTTCCTTPQCDINSSVTLTMENTLNVLSHYAPGENPDQYFNPAFYSDPKLEIYPGEPSNGALPRGRFQLPGRGQTTDGKLLQAGDWVQLTEVLTDGDWLLSKYIAPNQCPNGYTYLGSFNTNFYDHKGDNQGNAWAIFCGTNKNVVLTTTCPVHYESRGWIETAAPSTTAYDYMGKAVGGQQLQYCVHYNAFHFPKQTFTTGASADLNADNRIDIFDYNLLVTNFGKTGSNIVGDIDKNGKVDIFDYNELIGSFGK